MNATPDISYEAMYLVLGLILSENLYKQNNASFRHTSIK